MNYLKYSDLSNIILKNIHELETLELDLVVGIPRSGMIPAYMIALYLNVSCCSLQDLISNSRITSGNTRKLKRESIRPHNAKNILLVDDSINSGESMKNALNSIPYQLINKINTLAIISSSKDREDVDQSFIYVPSPRLFEWNIFHHSIIKEAAFDIDGVLCVDPTNEENDDGEKYRNFVLNAKPLILPTERIDTLVTNRLEKYRKETELWLKKYNVKYNKLVMLDIPTKEERQKRNIYAKHKAEEYKRSDLDLFVESSESQAVEINKITKKPVYCVETNELYTKEGVKDFFYQTKKTKIGIIKKLLGKLPKSVYENIRSLYKMFNKE